jgi:trk system potassium uptake protein TrkA
MYLIIVGGGKVGFYLAEELLRSNHEVLIIERSPARVAEITSALGENVMTGDGCEANTLDRAGVQRADVIVAVTGDDEDNLVVCEIAKFRGVPRCIARINHPRNEELFKRLGIETTVSATQAILAQIEQELPTAVAERIVELFELQGGVSLMEVRIPELSPVIGRRIVDLLLPADTLIVLLVRENGEAVVPHGDTELEAGDAVIVVGHRENEAQLREIMLGGSRGMDI